MKRPISLFDVLGVLSVLILLVVVAADVGALRAMGGETAIALSPEDLKAGFRDGVSWYGLYLNDEKIGFSRVEQRRVGDGLHTTNRLVVKPTVFGSSLEVSIALELVLDARLRPRRFDLDLDMGSASITASGEVREGVLELDVKTAGLEQHMTLDIGTATVDIGLKPAFLRSRPAIGARREFDFFDPVGLKNRTMTVEYLGPESLEILGEEIMSHHLRQYLEGQVLDAWVNDIGEVLREEMPLGIVATRETEADATYGFGRGAPAPAPEDLDPQDLLGFIAGLKNAIPDPSDTAGQPSPEATP